MGKQHRDGLLISHVFLAKLPDEFDLLFAADEIDEDDKERGKQEGIECSEEKRNYSSNKDKRSYQERLYNCSCIDLPAKLWL